jgi:hypothetical protein
MEQLTNLLLVTLQVRRRMYLKNRPDLFNQYIQNLNQALGSHAYQSDLDEIADALSTTPATGNSNASRLAQARAYAKTWDYNNPFDPSGHAMDPNMKNLTTQQVQDFLQEIRKNCGCSLKKE